MNHLISPNLVDSKPKSTAASRGSSRSSSRTNDAGNSYRDELTSLMDQKSKSSSSYSYSSKNNPRNQGASVSSSAPQAMLGSGNVEKGDLNEDGVVELLDRKLMSDYFFGRKVTYNLKNADFDDDGNVDVSDLSEMDQKLAKVGAFKSVLKGDANSDGKVDEADLEHMKKYMRGKASSINMSAVDADWNGKITATDLSKLGKLVAQQKTDEANSKISKIKELNSQKTESTTTESNNKNSSVPNSENVNDNTTGNNDIKYNENTNSNTHLGEGDNSKKDTIISKRILVGDVTGDGKIDISDTTALKKHVVSLEEITDDEMLKRADIDNDGKVGVLELGAITDYQIGIIDKKEWAERYGEYRNVDVKIDNLYDVNNDGIVDDMDGAIVRNEDTHSAALTNMNYANADFNNDGKVDKNDIKIIDDILKNRNIDNSKDNATNIKGDVNNDGKIDFADTYLIDKSVVDANNYFVEGLLSQISLNKEIARQADIDDNGKLTYMDLMAIKKATNNFSDIHVFEIHDHENLYSDSSCTQIAYKRNGNNSTIFIARILDEDVNSYKIEVQTDMGGTPKEYWIKKSSVNDFTQQIDKLVTEKMDISITKRNYRDKNNEKEKTNQNEDMIYGFENGTFKTIGDAELRIEDNKVDRVTLNSNGDMVIYNASTNDPITVFAPKDNEKIDFADVYGSVEMSLDNNGKVNIKSIDKPISVYTFENDVCVSALTGNNYISISGKNNEIHTGSGNDIVAIRNSGTTISSSGGNNVYEFAYFAKNTTIYGFDAKKDRLTFDNSVGELKVEFDFLDTIVKTKDGSIVARLATVSGGDSLSCIQEMVDEHNKFLGQRGINIKPGRVINGYVGATSEGGVVISDLKTSKARDGMVDVSFDVHNMKSTNAILTVYNSDGSVYGKPILIDKFTRLPTGFVEICEKTYDFIIDTMINYQKKKNGEDVVKWDDKLQANHESIDIKIPVGARIEITTDISKSKELAVQNAIDFTVEFFASLLSIGSDVATSSVKNKIERQIDTLISKENKEALVDIVATFSESIANEGLEGYVKFWRDVDSVLQKSNFNLGQTLLNSIKDVNEAVAETAAQFLADLTPAGIPVKLVKGALNLGNIACQAYDLITAKYETPYNLVIA